MSPNLDESGGEGLTRVGPGVSSGGRGGAERLPVETALGNYRVISCLGEGGMGQVYEVEHTVLLQRFALKLLHPDLAAGAGWRDRFVREARVMASLHHRGIVRVDDFGETGGRVWLRMELAEGVEVTPGHRVRTLGGLAEATGGRLAPAAVVEALEQILGALEVAHEGGLVHRDLKPANILLDAEGRMKISDFGLVQMAGDEWLRSRVNESVARSMSLGSAATKVLGSGSGSMQAGDRALMGTWDFMSPEQKSGGIVDARSDLYAVGLMGFRLLTGEAVLAMEGPSELVAGLDPAWDLWVRKAVASRPEKRFGSAREMAAALPRETAGARRPAAGTAVVAPPVPPAQAPPPVPRTTTPPPVPLPVRARAASPPAVPRPAVATMPSPPKVAAPPPPVSPPASLPAIGHGVADIVAGFERVAVRRVGSCAWNLLLPGLGLALRGRPLLGASLAVAGWAVAAGLGTFYEEPAPVVAALLAATIAAIVVVLIDGQGGPFRRLDRGRALDRARSLSGLYTAGMVLAIMAAALGALAAVAGLVTAVSTGILAIPELMVSTGAAVGAALCTWMAVRFRRMIRFFDSLKTPPENRRTG